MSELFNETIKAVCLFGTCLNPWRRSNLVDAAIIDPFAIHPNIEQFTRNACSHNLFTVTHVPTGMALCRHRTLRGAIGFINAVRGLGLVVLRSANGLQ